MCEKNQNSTNAVDKIDYQIEDLLINGIKIYQAPNLYRFTSDSVLLAKFAQKRYKNVLDLCAGSGIVGFHYYAEFIPDAVTFVEIQKSLSDMCLKSVGLNGLNDKMTVINDNLKNFNGGGKFDAVFCNPPYKKQSSGIVSKNTHIAICRAEIECTLDDIVNCAKKSLKHGGSLFMCHKPERLTDVICSFRANNIEPCRIKFISGKGSDKIYLFLIEGVLGQKKQLEVEGVLENCATDMKG